MYARWLGAMHKMKMIKMFILTHGPKVTCVVVCALPWTIGSRWTFFHIRTSLINISWVDVYQTTNRISPHHRNQSNYFKWKHQTKKSVERFTIQKNILQFFALCNNTLNLHQNEMRKTSVTHDMGPERNTIWWFLKSPIC